MTRSAFTTPDGCKLEYEVSGQGHPVLWQHGLGAPFSQPAAVFPEADGFQRITLACRGHEGSDLGPPGELTFTAFSNDALALLDHLGIERAVVGGISLGAAVAMRLAALAPARVRALILARPAWVDQVTPDTQGIYVEVGACIARHGLEHGIGLFQQRADFRALMQASPDNAKSMLSYFSRPRPETTVALLSAISSSFPGLNRAQIRSIAAPTLVIGNGEDVVHPLAFAQELASLIPGAALEIITSKTINAAAYEQEFKAALSRFFKKVMP
ncbi:MAG: alpha/beta fold hydrolase [Alphaproteobacteria bacterium]|nr:alpha/beta fold hydrolase [Alphaproteobacteria bacterium]